MPAAAAEYMERRARAVLDAAAAMQDVECDVELAGQTLAPEQDAAACALVRQAAEQTPGITEVRDEFRVTGGEDAPFLMRRVQANGGQACYFIIGADLTDFHHTAHFDFDEAAIPTGVRVFAGLARQVAAA